MEIIIRPVENEDFPAVFALASESVKYQISPLRESVDIEKARENFLRDLEGVRLNLPERPDSHFLIAMTPEDDFLGYIFMATDVVEGTTGIFQAWIFDIALKDNNWEGPVPHRLIDRAEEIARGKGLKHIALQVTCSYEKAMNFFKSRGYFEERKRMYKKLPFNEVDQEALRREMLQVFKGRAFKFKVPFKK